MTLYCILGNVGILGNIIRRSYDQNSFYVVNKVIANVSIGMLNESEVKW